MTDARALFGSDSESDDEPVAPKAAVRSDSSHEGTPENGVGTPPAVLTRPGTPRAPAPEDDDADSPDEAVSPSKRPFALLADEDESENEAEGEHPVRNDGEPKPEEEARGEEEAGTEEPVVEPEAEDDEETRIEVDIAKLDPDLGGRFIYWKLPDAMKIDTRPFDAEGYDDEFEDYEEDPDQAVQDQIRQKIKTTIRWRFATMPDGSRGHPESNTKLVKWSDGSYSVAIGDEYFDASFFPAKGEHHQLFIRQGTGLQGGVVFKERLQLRAAKPDAVARKSRLSSGARFSAGPRSGAKDEAARMRSVKMLSDDHNKDPEKHRAEMMRREEERLKASVRRETQQRRIRERVFNRGITGSYLEGNEEEDGNSISLSAIKNQFKRGDFTRPVYSDEDDSDNESRRKKLENAKDLDDDDDDFGVKKKKTEEGAKKRVAVIEDDDDD